MVLAGIFFLAYQLRPGAESAPLPRGAEHLPAPVEPPTAAIPVDAEPPAVADSDSADESAPLPDGPTDAQIIARLRDKFGKSIHHKHTQIKAIEALIAQLMKMYPDDWRSRVYDFLKQAFPELADALFAQFEKLLRFNDWMRDNRHEMMQMDSRDRREALWDARREFFGEDADEIWEITRRNEQILEALDDADDAGGGIEAKLEGYLDAIEEAYGEQAQDFLQRRRTELMLRFLSVESVQDDLHDLPAGERQEKLREIRSGLGLDDAAIARLEALDAERDREWAAGEQYMQERAALTEGDPSAVPQDRIDTLRQRYFGEQADMIRDEEAAGFFRYGHRRRYGRE